MMHGPTHIKFQNAFEQGVGVSHWL